MGTNELCVKGNGICSKVFRYSWKSLADLSDVECIGSFDAVVVFIWSEQLVIANQKNIKTDNSDFISILLTVFRTIRWVITVITPRWLLVFFCFYPFFLRFCFWNGVSISKVCNIKILGHPHLGTNGNCLGTRDIAKAY
jgi:hypothetical protein